MADLMTDTTSYQALANQYGNFIVPALKIKVNGTDVVNNLKLQIDQLTAHLSLKAASSVVIRLGGLYDLETSSFKSDVKDKFKLGTVVEIELGYSSTTQKVFKGYVAMLGVEFQDNALLVVTLMDARRLMMTSGKKQVLHDVTNYSDACATIMNNYSSLCTLTSDATQDTLKKPLSQITNDYDFVTKELIRKGKVDREFFIFGDKAYFREVGKNTTPIMTAQLNRELYEFTASMSYLDLQIEVVGYDGTEQAVISAKKDAKNTDNQTNIISTTPVMTVTDPDADSKDKADLRAAAIANQEKEKACTGYGKAIGLPEIVPGRYIEIEKLDSLVNKKFYIVEVKHVFDETGFLTYFEIGGCI
ncbi:phage late control D family protein [Anaeromicropila populeti]|uniref:Phage protein D n=1 Tax=Anaeromicropila populeti TaxID=37658 RepID=A0A1I6LTY5_9FIRM|nr:hypothetical protein [Anaeromicropila populeti]SFS06790.1 hypothetical protein SAMN05661086_03552 [Anaeromicropila populeti]